MLGELKSAIACPETMKREAYKRTLKARAFDVARYLLPLATNTSLGQIVNARTLESQISRLLTSPFAEIRTLGEKLRKSAHGVCLERTQPTRRAELIEDARDPPAATGTPRLEQMLRIREDRADAG